MSRDRFFFLAMFGVAIITGSGLAGRACGAGRPEAKAPYYVYARAGDPLRFVWSVKGGRSLGIVGEGPLRARCFVLDAYYRELTLTGAGGACREQSLPDVGALARALDLEVEEVPDDLVRIWRDGDIDWQPCWPVTHVPVAGVTDGGPYRLIDTERFRVFALRAGRGSLIVCYYGNAFTRVLRVAAPKREHVIRPGSGLKELVRDEGLVPSDIPKHLECVHAGRPVDWSEISGYRRY